MGAEKFYINTPGLLQQSLKQLIKTIYVIFKCKILFMEF